jgi:hypothetical protein
VKILLIDGRVVLIPAAKNVREANRGKEIECLGPRNRVLATFTAANIVGWWYDNEDVTIEAPQTSAEVPEAHAGGNGGA